jgi:hypothetical protein
MLISAVILRKVDDGKQGFQAPALKNLNIE